MLRFSLASLFLCANFAFAQEKDPKAPTPIVPADLKRTDAVVYEKEIQPILMNKCQVCHGGNVTEGKLDLTTYASMMKGGKRGVPLVAGKAEDSLLYKMVSHNIKPIMPPKNEDNPLTSKEVAVVKLWIDQGAKPPANDIKITRNVVLDLPPALVKPVRAISFSSDKLTVAAGRGNQVHLFDAKTGDFKKTLLDPDLKTKDGKPATAAHMSLVESMAYSPDGKLLVTGSFREAILWDAEKGTIIKKITGFADRVVAISFTSDSKQFATGGGAPTEDGELKIFDATGKQLQDIKNCHSDVVYGVHFSPDNKLLASSGADKFVKVFDATNGKFVKSFEGHTHHVLDVAWTGDGKKLVSAGADNIIKVWDYEKGEKIRDINAAKKQVTRLIMVPKSSQFIACDGDSVAKLYNAENGQQVRDFPGGKDFMYSVAVTDDGKTFATGGEEGIIRLYAGDGKLIKAMLPPGAEPKKEEPKK